LSALTDKDLCNQRASHQVAVTATLDGRWSPTVPNWPEVSKFVTSNQVFRFAVHVARPVRSRASEQCIGRGEDMQKRVLVVDDDESMRDMVAEMLADGGFAASTADNGEAALSWLSENTVECVLTDLQMPEMDGLALLGALREAHPHTSAVMMTSFGSIQTAVEAMRLGAQDFITKPFDADQLIVTIERVLELRGLEAENRRLRAAAGRVASFGDLVGKSAAMNEIYALIRKIESNTSNVLITGESGTGKEVVARTIHMTGTRSEGNFVPINCTAMPEGLLESELFGHVRGAFTGAHSNKRGLIEEASGGTLFLDEIGDMAPSLQGKLLRVLQDREVRPVGGNHANKVDIRLLAATNQDLRQEISEGRFREDLFYRLNVIPLHIPPLRERREDIVPLAQSFLAGLSGETPCFLSQGALKRLERADWPGNARELQNCMERSVALADADEIQASDILISESSVPVSGELEEMILELACTRRMTVRELSDRYTDAVLESTNGQKTESARILGVNRRTLYRRDERVRH
jgi:DNA-binding NtrC family response regulator